MNHRHRRPFPVVLAGALLALSIGMTGCGQKHIHVATTSDALGASEEPALLEERSGEPGSRGLSSADLQASSLEGEKDRDPAAAEQDPVMLAHEIALSPDTLPHEAETPSAEASADSGTRELPDVGQTIQSQSSSSVLPHDSLPMIAQSRPEGSSDEPFTEPPGTTPYPELEDSTPTETGNASPDPMAPLESRGHDSNGPSVAPQISGAARPDRDTQPIPPIAEKSPRQDQLQSIDQESTAAVSSSPQAEGLFQAEEPASFSSRTDQPEETRQPQPLVLGEEDTPGALVAPESIPEDIAVAKVEPSEVIRHQLDRFKEEDTGALHDVFFEFDSWALTPEGRAALETNADWLKAQPSARLVIQGHCDERGTQAYNMVLGEKRAMAIREYLIELGIEPGRLTIVSYGKEKPFCTDPTEVCYQLNRRGHFVVRQP